MQTNLISTGDFIDLFHKIRQKGASNLFKKLQLSPSQRVVSKWNSNEASSDFWIIPEVRERWCLKCTNDKNLQYEDYFVDKYLKDKTKLKMLSVACGTGMRERKFAKYQCFESIDAIDISPSLIETAIAKAKEEKLFNINYIAADFTKTNYPHKYYDIILFNSSLHHFKNVNNLFKKNILPLLKEDSFFVIFDYVGAKRLQWTQQQLEFANEILKKLPPKYKTRTDGITVKNKIYRPGILRMLIVDPSEAADSENILPAIHKYFSTLEEHHIGWDITQLVFKDIAHNFLNEEPETKDLLSYIFEQEDIYMKTNNSSDAIFGIYKN